MAPGTVLNDRYRLESGLSDPDPVQGCLWLGKDLLAVSPVVINQLVRTPHQDSGTTGCCMLLQLPRFGELGARAFWAVRDWQDGNGFDQILEQRRERQLVFGPSEVLLLLRRSCLCWLSCMAAALCMATSPRNLLRAATACLCCWTSASCRPMGNLLCLEPRPVIPRAPRGDRNPVLPGWICMGLG